MKKIFLLLSVFLGIYLVGVLMFIGRFSIGSYVDNISLVYKTPGEAAMELTHQTQSNVITFVSESFGTECLTFEQLGIVRTGDLNFGNVKTNCFLWFVPKTYTIQNHFSYDDDVLKNGLQNLSVVRNGLIDSVSAYVVKQSDGSYQVIPEVIGDRIDIDKLKECVLNSLSSDFIVDVDKQSCYQVPDVIVGDNGYLMFHTDDMNERLVQIVLDFGIGVQEVISEDDLKSMYFVENGRLCINYDAIVNYVDLLRQNYDTYGKERLFHTSMNTDLYVSTIDQTVCDFAGWELDTHSLVDSIYNALIQQQDVVIEVPWLHRGVDHGKDNDFGNTYLEISIDNQHMWLYVDSQLVCDTDVVTGLATMPNRVTPRGVFRTTDFYREHTMTGSYGSAFCHYFIRVTLNGIGIHDASWRSEFGGSIYLNDGSHGCINTPYDAEKLIFETLYGRNTYTPIIIW